MSFLVMVGCDFERLIARKSRKREVYAGSTASDLVLLLV